MAKIYVASSWRNQHYPEGLHHPLAERQFAADLEALADRILLLGHGQLLFDGQLSDLRARYDTVKTLTVHYTGPAPAELPPDCTVLERREGMLALANGHLLKGIRKLTGKG